MTRVIQEDAGLNWKYMNDIPKGAARILLCSALTISILRSPVSVHAADQQMLTTGIEDNDSFRVFRYRTLKALNELRDLGLTPQAIVETLGQSDQIADATDSATTAISDYTSDVGQEIAGAVQEKANEVVRDVTDKATEAAKEQMNNWVDSLGESIGQAIREFIDGIMGGNND